MGNLFCCVPCRKKRKTTKTRAIQECGAKTLLDTRQTKNDDEIVLVTGAMTGFYQVVRPSQTVRIVVNYCVSPVRVERSVLPALSAAQLEGYYWAMILRYTADFLYTFVIDAVREDDSLQTMSQKSAAIIEGCSDRTALMIEARPDRVAKIIEAHPDSVAKIIEARPDRVATIIAARPDTSAPVGLSQEEEIAQRAELEKAAHLKAKRKANFKKLKAKIKARKSAEKMANSGSPTVENSSQKLGTDNTNALDSTPVEFFSRPLRTDNRLEWFMDMDAPDLPVD